MENEDIQTSRIYINLPSYNYRKALIIVLIYLTYIHCNHFICGNQCSWIKPKFYWFMGTWFWGYLNSTCNTDGWNENIEKYIWKYMAKPWTDPTTPASLVMVHLAQNTTILPPLPSLHSRRHTGQTQVQPVRTYQLTNAWSRHATAFDEVRMRGVNIYIGIQI